MNFETDNTNINLFESWGLEERDFNILDDDEHYIRNEKVNAYSDFSVGHDSSSELEKIICSFLFSQGKSEEETAQILNIDLDEVLMMRDRLIQQMIKNTSGLQ